MGVYKQLAAVSIQLKEEEQQQLKNICNSERQEDQELFTLQAENKINLHMKDM